MLIEEEFKKLLGREDVDGTIEFLKGLSPENRRLIVPLIKKLHKEYNVYIQHGNSFTNRMTYKEGYIFDFAAFCCYNRNEYEKYSSFRIIQKPNLEKVLNWYIPTWFSDFINSFAEKEWILYSFEYFYANELIGRGLFEASPHLLARLLVPIIIETRETKNYFVPEKLALLDITLKEHIWYLFQYETNINSFNNYIYFDNNKGGDEKSWIAVFKKYETEGKIERLRLLKEALLASNRNFNKPLSGWFAELFIQLKPSKIESLSLQQELLSLCSSPHSKVVNTALQGLKLIVDDPSFDAYGFFDYVPILLASETKVIIVSTLQVLEKVAKKDSNTKQRVTLLSTGALLHKDESLQGRVANIIQKFGTKGDIELGTAINMYTTSMFSGVKAVLFDYIITNDIIEDISVHDTNKAPNQNFLTEEIKLPSINNLDELLFLTSQAFDNNQDYHIDLLPASLVILQHTIKDGQIGKLEPAFQRALKLFMGDMRSNQGELDSMLALFFLDFGQLLMQKYPEATNSLRILYSTNLNKTEATRIQWADYGKYLNFLGGCNINDKRKIYEPQKKILTTALKRIDDGNETPLLSTPTHLPCWIHPSILIDRLYYYQQNNLVPDEMDLQVAISRCWLKETNLELKLLENKLTGEYKRVMRFLLDPDGMPIGPFTTEWIWMTAAITKTPGVHYNEFDNFHYPSLLSPSYSGQYTWRTIIEDYVREKYDYSGGKFTTIKITDKRKVLQLDIESRENDPKKTGFLQKFIKIINGNKQPVTSNQVDLVYDFLSFNRKYITVEDRDIKRIIYLAPNQPELIIAAVINVSLHEPQILGESEKRFLLETLKGLYEIWKPLGDIGHLFLATSLICSDKTAASFAGEIWIKGVTENNINSSLIGKQIGLHERIEFVPLKRFTDLITGQLMGVSPAHNRALEELITALLKELTIKPIKHLKKLLELYYEILASNNTTISDDKIVELIQTWNLSPAIKRNTKKKEYPSQG